MKIGFYGDSFCCEISNPHSILKSYDTYIKKLQKNYKAEIINLGVGGSSIWDVILQQFDKNKVPDVCIFCWTDHNRLYHKKVRNMTLGSIENKKIKDVTLDDILHFNTILAAKKYFTLLHDEEKSRIEQLAALQYFDLNVLSNIDTTIVHLWSFDPVYKWQNGTTIDTPLINFVKPNQKGFETWAANHLGGDETNEKVFQIIRTMIDDHHQLLT